MKTTTKKTQEQIANERDHAFAAELEVLLRAKGFQHDRWSTPSLPLLDKGSVRVAIYPDDSRVSIVAFAGDPGIALVAFEFDIPFAAGPIVIDTINNVVRKTK